MIATRALVPMPTQFCRSAACNGGHYFQMRPLQPGTVLLDEGIADRSHNGRHL
jgi:hypothetical protein